MWAQFMKNGGRSFFVWGHPLNLGLPSMSGDQERRPLGLGKPGPRRTDQRGLECQGVTRTPTPAGGDASGEDPAEAMMRGTPVGTSGTLDASGRPQMDSLGSQPEHPPDTRCITLAGARLRCWRNSSCHPSILRVSWSGNP